MSIDWLIDWLIEYGLASRSRIFQLYRYVAVVSEGMQNVGLNSVLIYLEQGGIFIVPCLLWQGTSVNMVSYEKLSRLMTIFDKPGTLPRSQQDIVHFDLLLYGGLKSRRKRFAQKQQIAERKIVKIMYI